ncbi:hypothetical protein AYI83_21490 [Shewanella algae]|uniref:hypothetical protein n=1 Tax=Shewanella algae TaxID=38313 RepID=UPI0011839588|nr:hypothetical protein [Shewanella algae]TVK90676.1 hypothetical protein AYI83_21490 [Shewanella algae]
MLNVTWGTCGDDGHWCSFINLNLNSEGFKDKKGVYIIWSGETVVRVGSGIIKNRIADHRDNRDITKYPDLKVTWAKVNANQMEGVEKYLADTLSPVVGERFPERTPIEVNLPWA